LFCLCALLPPLAATSDWEEDRKGHPPRPSLLSPALSSIRWRRGSHSSSGCTGLQRIADQGREGSFSLPTTPLHSTANRVHPCNAARARFTRSLFESPEPRRMKTLAAR